MLCLVYDATRVLCGVWCKVLRACYAVSGVWCYVRAMHSPVLTQRMVLPGNREGGTVLRGGCFSSGTKPYPISRTARAYGAEKGSMGLRCSYAQPGPDIGYAATRSTTPPSVLRVRYAMSGTVVACGAMRCAVLSWRVVLCGVRAGVQYCACAVLTKRTRLPYRRAMRLFSAAERGPRGEALPAKSNPTCLLPRTLSTKNVFDFAVSVPSAC
eukprot:3940914-Rhodomonas_salina.3